MIEKIDNYQDAVDYIKQDIDGPFDKRIVKVCFIKAAISDAIVGAIMAGTMLITNGEIVLPGAIPIVMLFNSAIFFVPLVHRHREKEALRRDEFDFQGMSEEEVIQQANLQIEVYNEEERKAEKRRRKARS